MVEETFEYTFPTSTPCRLTLSNIRGSVEILGGDDSAVHVTAVKHLDTGNAEQTEVIAVQNEDGSIYVETRYNNGITLLLNQKPCKVDYFVRMPARCTLKLSGVSNQAAVKNLSGEIDISSVSGAMQLETLGGKLKLNTVSGAVQGSAITGELTLESVSADVHLKASGFEQINATTVSGKIHIDTTLDGSRYSFNSVSGNVILLVPESAGCTIQSKSISGKIHTSQPLSGLQHYGAYRKQVIGDGRAEIQHSSISGDIRLLSESGENITPTSASHPQQPNKDLSPEDRLHLLDQIANGEVTVDQALTELSSE